MGYRYVTKLFTKGEEEKDSVRFLKSSQGKGNVLTCGPECVFRGKNVPCLVQWSKSGGVNATILTNCLRHMDELNLFQRNESLKPFVLLDGHSSRFDLEFVKYIRDDEHRWSVCIGLPYGMHIWQVGDSPQQNGSFKFHQNAMKEKILEEKKALNLTTVFCPTDIIPIVNYAWDRSFARTESNKTAIIERGWNPLNYALLTSPEVIRTQINNEKYVSTSTETTTETPESDETPIPASWRDSILNDNVSYETGTAAMALDTIVQSSLARIKQQKIAMKTNTDRLNKTKKITSGVAFKQGTIAIHSDAIYCNLTGYEGHKNKTNKEKKKRVFIAWQKRKAGADAIRSKQEDKWTVGEIKRLLSYKYDKKLSTDLPTKDVGSNRTTLMELWNCRKGRTSPQCSPYNSDDDDNNNGVGADDDDEIDFFGEGEKTAVAEI